MDIHVRIVTASQNKQCVADLFRLFESFGVSSSL